MRGSILSRKVQEYILKNYKNSYVVNVIQANKAGTPDLLACIAGTFYALEIKGDGDKLSKLQDLTLDKIAKSGGISAEIRDLDQLQRVIEEKPLYVRKYADDYMNL